MSAKDAITAFCLTLLVLFVELIAYFFIGYPPAFIGGDMRSTYIFLPFIAVTGVAAALFLVHAVTGVLTTKPTHAGYLKFVLGFVFLGLSTVSFLKVHNINMTISAAKRAEAALPLPPSFPLDHPIVSQLSSSMQGDSPSQRPVEDKLARADQILQLTIPDAYWHQAVKEFPDFAYVALVAHTGYGDPPGSKFPQAIVLIKFHQVLQTSLSEAASIFLRDPHLQPLYRDKLVPGQEVSLEINGERILVVKAIYQGAQGVAGKLARPGGDIVFLIWPPKGYDLRPADFAWLFNENQKRP